LIHFKVFIRRKLSETVEVTWLIGKTNNDSHRVKTVSVLLDIRVGESIQFQKKSTYLQFFIWCDIWSPIFTDKETFSVL